MTDSTQRELAALEQFIAVLQREQEALISADIQPLPSIAETKQQLAEQLNGLARERAATLASAGFAADAVGGWLAGQPQAVRDTWQKLLEQAQIAQRLNQTNGKLIQTHLQYNQQALSTMMNAANAAGVYGPDGQPCSSAGTAPRSIGKV